MRSVVVFSVLRVLAFLVPFGVLLLFPAFQELPWLAAVFAAIIGLALSILFLRRPLDAVSAGLADRRAGRRAARTDADVEDEVDDAARARPAAVAPSAAPHAGASEAAVPSVPDAAASPGSASAPSPAAGGSADQPTNAQNSSPA